MTSLLLDPRFTGTLEIVGSRIVDHAFVIVNRQNTHDVLGLEKVSEWGDEAFVIDIWHANQRLREPEAANADEIKLESHIISDPNSWAYAKRVWANLPDGSELKTNGLIEMQIWRAEDRAKDRADAIQWITEYEGSH